MCWYETGFFSTRAKCVYFGFENVKCPSEQWRVLVHSLVGIILLDNWSVCDTLKFCPRDGIGFHSQLDSVESDISVACCFITKMVFPSHFFYCSQFSVVRHNETFTYFQFRMALTIRTLFFFHSHSLFSSANWVSHNGKKIPGPVNFSETKAFN